MASPEAKAYYDPEWLAENQAPQLVPIVTSLVCLATFFTVLRFWARYNKSAPYAADDWVLLASLVVTWASTGVVYRMISHGMGQHFVALPPSMFIEQAKDLFGLEFLYIMAIALIKTSVLLMYLRIFPDETFRTCCFVIQAVVVAWWLSIGVACIFQCTPIRKAWMGPLVEGHCVDLRSSFIGNAVPNMVTDVAILILPITQVWGLQINIAQRLSMCFMFLLGSFVTFASAYRFTTLLELDMMDPSYTIGGTAVWSTTEAACGIISACLPTLRPLVKKFSRRFFSPSPDELPVKRNSHPLPDDPVTVGGSTSTKVDDNSEVWSDNTSPRLEDGDKYRFGGGTCNKETIGTSEVPTDRGLFKLERGTQRQLC